MREFVIQITVGAAAALGWFVIWTVALRAFDIRVLTRTPEERASRRERILRMGKGRYILIFGLLGFGLAMGLWMAVISLVEQQSPDWVGAAIRLVLWTVIFGWWHGARGWNQSFRAEIPFPPHLPAQK
jgi:heme A synthase